MTTLELVQKAIDNNQIKELFLGEGEYKQENLKHIPALVATDIGSIIDNGLYILFNEGEKTLPNKIISVIRELVDTNEPFSIWTAYFILRYQYRNELQNKSPFNIVTKELCKSVSNKISNQKQNLMLCQKYVGFGLPNGLWDDIQRLENNLVLNYGVSIL